MDQLARSFVEQGHSVLFISDLPRSRLAKFKLENVTVVTIWIVTVITIISRALKKARIDTLAEWFQELRNPLLDFFAPWRLRPCDIVITMSGIGLKTAVTARSKYGARFWTERSSLHIRHQLQILMDSGVPKHWSWDRHIEREELCYNLADMIVVPTTYCATSLIDRGIDRHKIFVSSFGIDTDFFSWTKGPDGDDLKFLVVGNWTKQKGAHLLESVARNFPRIHFEHFGSIGDVPKIESLPNFSHRGFIDQTLLPSKYAQAHALIVPSLQDGFGLVILQALACGLIVFCSDRTGGVDLLPVTCLNGRLIVFQNGSSEAIIAAISNRLNDLSIRRRDSGQASAIKTELSFRSYGLRYFNRIQSSLK